MTTTGKAITATTNETSLRRLRGSQTRAYSRGPFLLLSRHRSLLKNAPKQAVRKILWFFHCIAQVLSDGDAMDLFFNKYEGAEKVTLQTLENTPRDSLG